MWKTLCSQFTGSVFARSLKFNFKYFVLIKKIKLIIQLVRSSLTSCCIQIFIWDWKGLSQFHIWQKTFKEIFHTLIYSVRVKHVTCVCMRSTSVKPFGIRCFQVIMSNTHVLTIRYCLTYVCATLSKRLSNGFRFF